MSDVLSALTTILDVAFKIKEVVGTVKANKNQCLVLNERVQIIADLAKKLRAGVKDLTTFEGGLNAAERCLQECLTFVTTFKTSKWYKQVLHNGSNKEKFSDLNDSLQKSTNTLSLGIVIDLDIKISAERAKDAEAKDRAELNNPELQQNIALAHKKEQEQLQKIYDLQQQIKKDDAQRALEVRRKDEMWQLQLKSMQEQLAKLAQPQVIAKPALPIDKNLIINLADLDIMGVIGEGSNATVYAGKLYDMDVAVKMLRNPTPQLVKELYREATILARLKGDNTVRCHGVCIEEGRECLVMELMHNGSLNNYLADMTKLLTPELQKQWAIEIAKGINCLHKQNAIHRDLKPSNILLTKDNHAKLADFDLSVINTSSLGAVAHTSQAFEYMAPELKSLKPTASCQSDIYSYGVILWELVTRQKAPVNKTQAMLQQAPEPYQSIIASCLEATPGKRPQLDEIITTIEAYQLLDCRTLYQQGAEFEKASQFKEAMACYQQSAELGYGRSEFRIAMLLLQGKMGTPNKVQAFNYLLKCASHESHDQPKACYNLASMLEKGDGVTQDLSQALHWYNESARLGNTDAVKKIELLKQKGTPSYQDNLSSFGIASSAKPMVQPRPSAPLMSYGTPSAQPMSDNNYQDNLSSIGLVSQMSKLAIK